MEWLNDINYLKTKYTETKALKIFETALLNNWEANSHNNIPTFEDFKEDGIVKKNKNDNEYFSIFTYKDFIWVEDCDYGNEIIKILEEETK